MNVSNRPFAAARSDDTAWSLLFLSLESHVEIRFSKKSATATILAPTGIASPLRPSGYPDPSQDS